jgi:hypothetical protein
MTDFVIATEDALSEALAESLLHGIGGHSVARTLRRNGFGYLKRQIQKFDQIAAKVMPVLLVTDLDRATCAPGLIASWLPRGPNARLLFRVAVRETESWLLADRAGFADFLGISPSHLPERPDELPDPKQSLLKLVRKSRRRSLKQEILPAPGVSAPVGLGYNEALSQFARDDWDYRQAARASPSLARTVARLERFSP